MSRLIRFDPFRDGRLGARRSFLTGFPFEDFLDGDLEATLSIDMYETDNDVVIETDLPGVNPDDVDIEVTSENVTISAQKKEEIEEKKKDYVRRERSYGKYSRTINLPTQVVAADASADFEDGTLKLIMPKEVKAMPTTVKVAAKKDK